MPLYLLCSLSHCQIAVTILNSDVFNASEDDYFKKIQFEDAKFKKHFLKRGDTSPSKHQPFSNF